jgi:hypothetical protein
MLVGAIEMEICDAVPEALEVRGIMKVTRALQTE